MFHTLLETATNVRDVIKGSCFSQYFSMLSNICLPMTYVKAQRITPQEGRYLTFWGPPIKAWADPKSGSTKTARVESIYKIGRISCHDNQISFFNMSLSNLTKKNLCTMSTLLKEIKSF